MPYIKQEHRKYLDIGIDELIGRIASLPDFEPGNLNYVITRLLHYYVTFHDGESNYTRYNAAVGVLECAKLELYRRQISAYEDKKIKENGDV